MYKIIVSLSILVAVANAQWGPAPIAARLAAGGLLEDNSPKPYSYAYNTADEFGTQWTREEASDGNGNVRGSYSYREANGIGRRVTYVVDPVNGFQASVETNEPGTLSSAPAGAQIRSAQGVL